jgi:hypothetical protein
VTCGFTAMITISASPPAVMLSVVVRTPSSAILLRLTSHGSETVMFCDGIPWLSSPPIIADAMLPPPMKASLLFWREGIVQLFNWPFCVGCFCVGELELWCGVKLTRLDLMTEEAVFLEEGLCGARLS